MNGGMNGWVPWMRRASHCSGLVFLRSIVIFIGTRQSIDTSKFWIGEREGWMIQVCST